MENKSLGDNLKPHHQRIVTYLIGIIVLLALVAGGLAVYVLKQNKNVEVAGAVISPYAEITDYEPARGPTETSAVEAVSWMQTETGWQANGTPPECPDPAFVSPADTSLATSILYPGQTRGGNYKPHGGFRFDTIADNQVEVQVPLDAVIINGARYLVDGETQYTFDFVAPCGLMYRLGHLLTLSPKFQAIADQFPPAQEGDSRTTQVEPNVAVTAGEVMATAVGVTKGQNTFFDFGVYNLRTKNVASQDAAWAASHDPSLAPYAVCWFDMLPTADSAKVTSLPAGDPTSGKTSDYCN